MFRIGCDLIFYVWCSDPDSYVIVNVYSFHAGWASAEGLHVLPLILTPIYFIASHQPKEVWKNGIC